MSIPQDQTALHLLQAIQSQQKDGFERLERQITGLVTKAEFEATVQRLDEQHKTDIANLNKTMERERVSFAEIKLEAENTHKELDDKRKSDFNHWVGVMEGMRKFRWQVITLCVSLAGIITGVVQWIIGMIGKP